MDGLDFPRVGFLPSGQLDAITDVGDIRVGHCTLDEGNVHTGVTVVLPNDDPLMQKPLAASCIFNGFGKSVGLMQMAELGCLETPLALTNTFSVGAIATAQIRAAVSAHPEVGREWSTVNPLVLECNDGYLNDIQALAVTEKHYIEACASASREFMQGSVGAGRGMSCFHLKGGIGSASRIAECGGQAFTVGALVLSNFGKAEHCLLAGRPVGHLLQERLDRIGAEAAVLAAAPEKGSIIMLLATDAPLDVLQLGRLARRAGNGLARTGSLFGHGSGDVASISRSWRNPPCRFFMHRTAGWTDCFRLPPRRPNKLFSKPCFLRNRLSGAMDIDGPPFRKFCRNGVISYGAKKRNSSGSEYGENDAHFDFCGY